MQGIRREADGKSLVLLDEVGTGTDPGQGAALGAALLQALAKGGARGAGFVLATTHHRHACCFMDKGIDVRMLGSVPGFRVWSQGFLVGGLRDATRLALFVRKLANLKVLSEKSVFVGWSGKQLEGGCQG